MTEPSERIPVDDDYLRALGRATYNFSYLEWNVICLTEVLQRGFLEEASKLTAGKIGCKFSSAVDASDITDPDKTEFKKLACNFRELVLERNRLMHGNPHTTGTGEQHLLSNGKLGRKDWTIDLMKKFSCRTAIASIKAGELLHGERLQQYQRGKP